MPTNKNVLIDREKYIGGSEISTILGINPFQTRYELLLEKSGVEENNFEGNEYTEYGDVMEGVIRDYINKQNNCNFIEYTISKDKEGKIGDRCNYDGYDENIKETLEIKTTSQVHDNIEDYKRYIVQQLWGLELSNFKTSVLAVYERDELFKEKTPEQWVEEFNPLRLQVFKIDIDDYLKWLEEIDIEVERFKDDLNKIKENPLLSENDFIPIEVKNYEIQIQQFYEEEKKLEEKKKEFREKLFDAMLRNGVKSWKTNNGLTITRVDETQEKTTIVQELDENKLKEDYKEIYENCLKEVTKVTKKRKGYITIK